MRRFLHAIAVTTALCSPAAAQTLSAEIATSGLAATGARLAALPAPTDADRFALGGVRFLAAVERGLQIRWQVGLTEQLEMLPVLRLPLAPNPSPAPPDSATIATLFRDLTAAMSDARAPLSAIPDTSDLAVEITLQDLWFDVNANRTRDPGEDVLDIAGAMLMGGEFQGRDPAAPTLTVRFDVADAAWLTAYTHLLEGIGDIVLAYDPTAPIAEITGAFAALQGYGPLIPDPLFGGGAGAFGAVDIAAVVLKVIGQTPDRDRAASARQNLLAMVAQNRRFWTLVATEADNDREWVPNDAQQSALPLEFPQGTGARWLAVLSDGEKLLTGELLVPYWRVTAAGINVGRMFTDPRPIDLIGWIQGVDALPYLERGPMITPENWSAFEALMSGNAGLMAIMLN